MPPEGVDRRRAGGVKAIAADDTGHMLAVAVTVAGPAVNKCLRVYDAGRVGTVQIVGVRHSAVDQCDAYARSIKAILKSNIRVDCRLGVFQGSLYGVVGRDVDHFVIRRERRDCRRRNAVDRRVHRIENAM